MNNVGLIGLPTKLSRIIGEITRITDPSVINAITGTVDLGFMAFDTDGTMGVCTDFSRDENENPIYTFRTTSLNTEIDITYLLSQDY